MPPMVKCWEGGRGDRGESDEEAAAPSRRAAQSGYAHVDTRWSTSYESEACRTDVTVVSVRHRNSGSSGATDGSYPDEGARHCRGKGVVRALANSALVDKEQQIEDRKITPPWHTEDVESVGASSASSVVAQELSISSLPPMGMSNANAELIFEESSLEDSGVSVSQMPSSEKRLTDFGGGRGGGNKCGGGARGRRGGPFPRQRHGSADVFVRTRCDRVEAGCEQIFRSILCPNSCV